MNTQRTYRDLLVSTLVTLEYHFQQILSLGMTLVTYEDARTGVLPFEDGDEIPIFIEVFEASSILAVQAVAHAAPTIAEMIAKLINLNRITREEIEAQYETDENGNLIESESEEWKEQTWEGLKDDLYLYFSDMVYIINENAYWMKFGHEQLDNDEHDFYMPTPATYEMLATDDTNFSELLRLSKYLEDHRSLAYR